MKLPSNYLVIDLETSGLSPADNFIWSVGLLAVLDGQPQTTMGEDFYLSHPPAMLKTATFEINRRKANAQGITADRATLNERTKDGQYYIAEEAFVKEVTEKGKDPKEVLQHVADMINMFTDNKWPSAGANYVKFDFAFLNYWFNYYSIKCDLPRERLIDTGILIKAAQLRRNQAAHESCKEFYVRVAAERAKGVFFSVDWCCKYFGLVEKLGLDMTKAHGAGFDCYITNLVLKEMVNEVLASEGVMV